MFGGRWVSADTKKQLHGLYLGGCPLLRVSVGPSCAQWYTPGSYRHKEMVLCVFLFVWEIKLNLESVIAVVWKAGGEGALILQVDGAFFPFSQLSLGEHLTPKLQISSAFKLEASS